MTEQRVGKNKFKCRSLSTVFHQIKVNPRSNALFHENFKNRTTFLRHYVPYMVIKPVTMVITDSCNI